ncbi:hypothetical protein AB0B45_02835 [Nonomuraea sp. NPDC049152]|uniref:hypothetical protein n=1 Tax=Nonomuraea sp. NPDC049152 TaxID=3154350 RepID=UPI0033FF2C02
MTATIPPPWQVHAAAHAAGASTSHVLDALAFTAANYAAERRPLAQWDDLLQGATERTMGAAAAVTAEEAEEFGYDIEDGFTYDDLDGVSARRVTAHALVAATLWADKNAAAA